MVPCVFSFASVSIFFFNDTATTEIYTLSLHDALPIFSRPGHPAARRRPVPGQPAGGAGDASADPGRAHLRRSEEHTSELQSRLHLVCRLLLEKKKKKKKCEEKSQTKRTTKHRPVSLNK